MKQTTAEKFGFVPSSGAIYRNLKPAVLIEHAIRRGEGHLSKSGALVVYTGTRTGRSAKDKFIVDSRGVHDQIAWGKVNVPVDQEVFDDLYHRVLLHFSQEDVYVVNGYAGASPEYAIQFRIVTELASQALFIHQLLRRPTDEQLITFKSEYTVLVAPTFKCVPERDHTNSDAAIMLDLEHKRIIIVGTQYSGEIKKSIFSIMNYILPSRGVFPMHCSANIGADGRSAIFFGLSGTGKTTISAVPERRLIGDDEHGWADDEVFNFEGGCYAKCIDLTEEHEPDIYRAIRFGSLVENVVLDPDSRELDFTDDSLTMNTRVAYPIDYIDNIEPSGRGAVPSTVIFLTADAFGVLPPVSRLTLDQARYYFLSGYTSKVAGTEMGIEEPVPTFSTCFGEPFLPLDPVLYAKMLKEKVEAAGADVFLVNTGWNGKGKRMAIKHTRAMVDAALNGQLTKEAGVEFVTDPYFGLAVPTTCPNVPDEVLIPSRSWDDHNAYEAAAKKLAGMFRQNFEAKYDHVPEEIKLAGPTA